MNVHKNARLTPRGRERIVRQVESGQAPKAVAEAAGVCPRTVRKWVDRYHLKSDRYRAKSRRTGLVTEKLVHGRRVERAMAYGRLRQSRLPASSVQPCGSIAAEDWDAGGLLRDLGRIGGRHHDPVGDSVTMHMVLTFPRRESAIRIGRYDAYTNLSFPNLKIGALCLLGYGIDNAWEIVPGLWTEQI